VSPKTHLCQGPSSAEAEPAKCSLCFFWLVTKSGDTGHLDVPLPCKMSYRANAPVGACWGLCPSHSDVIRHSEGSWGCFGELVATWWKVPQS